MIKERYHVNKSVDVHVTFEHRVRYRCAAEISRPLTFKKESLNVTQTQRASNSQEPN